MNVLYVFITFFILFEEVMGLPYIVNRREVIPVADISQKQKKTLYEYVIITESPTPRIKEAKTYFDYVVVTKTPNPKPSQIKTSKTEYEYIVVTETPEQKPSQKPKTPKTVWHQEIVTENSKAKKKKIKTEEVHVVVTEDPRTKTKKIKTQEVHVVVTETPKTNPRIKTSTLIESVFIPETKSSSNIGNSRSETKTTVVFIEENASQSTKESSTSNIPEQQVVTRIVVSIVSIPTQQTSTVEIVELPPEPTPLIPPNDPLISPMYDYKGPYSLNKTFQEIMLLDHKAKRARHGVAPLKWSSECYNFASDYASQYDCSGILTHSGGKLGENLAYGYTPLGAMNAWYVEGEEYIYGTEKIYNHFTAMVWNRTTEMACATHGCPRGLYIICSYNPPGNVIGYSTRNVFPPLY